MSSHVNEVSAIVADPQRVKDLNEQQLFKCHSETDRLFAGLMVFQLIGGIVMALVVSPYTWIGNSSSVHLHVTAAIGLGAMLSALPIALALMCPGEPLTRHIIAVAQMLWAALLIHLSGGRVETHFHIFGSLAFLAFYRDWKVLLTATVVVATDHFIRGVFWPLSVFGVMVESPYRWIEHAAWVIFEDFVLVLSCLRGTREITEVSRRSAELEATNASIEQTVADRTSELNKAYESLAAAVAEQENLQAREMQLGKLVEQSVNEIYIFDKETLRFHEINRAALLNIQYEREEFLKLTPLNLFRDITARDFVTLMLPLSTGQVTEQTLETNHHRKDGSSYPVEVHIQMYEWDSKPAYVAIALDISERQEAEKERDEIHKQLVDTSRMAGMAEIATGVLHNVGNVLNSLNVSAVLIHEKLQDSRVGNFERVADLLTQNEDQLGEFMASNPKGKMIPRYLADLSKTVATEREEIFTELASLTSNVNHIKEIVQTQQTYATVSGAIEELVLEEVIAEAVHVEMRALQRHGITVEYDYDKLPPIRTQKHKLMQILVNLIGNAKNAIEESGATDRRLTLRLLQEEGFACIDCIDTGGGIAPENIDSIFNHGFTTRENGHGFGLHSSANAAGEVGGSLTVSSDGPGTGATFRIRLPLDAPTEEAAEPQEDDIDVVETRVPSMSLD